MIGTARQDDVVQELRRITKLLVLIVTKDETQQQQIARLSKVGFSSTEIADLIGTTRSTVTKTLSRLKSRK